ncbi:glutamate dehydrogenase [Aerococcus urinaehominis]|uniref:Glutamate dehydrogenase n=1 Tax=Aerococcus urinaehominis TaxID=128944 RepID=A0A0X8FJU9_9LACT|nr:NADP-specific glutamate dehydrogenase [Aerococcus urinaehominis]AMB98660.1 glutamate dehydrogenase [Aerococcus urinaehominis]SDL97580.1 glutamate dehydrogenase (NADP+) [Aerococcus urinaehominis]
MSAQEYVNRVLASVQERHQDKPEFVQAVEEFLPTIAGYVAEHPEIEAHNLLEIMVEPERVIQFRVPWQDDQGNWRVNLGYRVQYNSALGPYKGGLRFHPSVNESIVRFLGFEQIFKNALTSLPIGGGKGGSDFDPSGKSDAEVMRFCQSFMTELQKYIGPDRDVPAGDIGVRAREIGYMYGQYKRLNQTEPGVLTGKPTNQWGSFARTEATGYGVVYFAQNALADRGQDISGKRVVISGRGTVAMYAVEKAEQLGATVIAVSDITGYVYDEAGISAETLKNIPVDDAISLDEYTKHHPDAKFYPNESVWAADLSYDVALPCATQNEINAEMAQNMVDHGVKYVFEGANMPSQEAAVEIFDDNKVLFGPAKAVNAGGVAVSALEMAQNSQRLQWTFEEVDGRLQETMKAIYDACSNTAKRYSHPDDLRLGANVAGFARVSEVMLAQGLV